MTWLNGLVFDVDCVPFQMEVFEWLKMLLDHLWKQYTNKSLMEKESVKPVKFSLT